MGFDYECILNIHSLSGDYFCPVCRLLVYPSEALQTQCTHLFCKACLTYIIRTTHIYPYDGYRVTESDSKPLLESNKAFADAIDKIQVRCLYYMSGCKWQGFFSDSTSHCSTCAFGESSVMCNRCGIQIVHRLVPEHNQNCPGVHSRAQLPCVLPNAAVITSESPLSQKQTPAQIGPLPSQPQVQAYPTSAPPISVAVTNVYANPRAHQQDGPSALPMLASHQDYLQQCNYPYFPAAHQYPPLPSVISPQACGQYHPQTHPQAPRQEVEVAQFRQMCPHMQQPPAMMSRQCDAPRGPPAHQYRHPQPQASRQQVPVAQFQQNSPQMQQPPVMLPCQGEAPYAPPAHPHPQPQPQPYPHLLPEGAPQVSVAQFWQICPQMQRPPMMLSGQGEAPSSPPSQHPFVYPHSQQSGYPFQQFRGVLTTQQTVPLQSFSGQGPPTEQRPPVQAHFHAQGQSPIPPQQIYGLPHFTQLNIAQHHTGHQVVTQGTGFQFHAPATELTGAGQLSSVQMNQPQAYQGSNQSSMLYRPVPQRLRLQMPTPMPLPGNPQQSVVQGHQLNHGRPQGPYQVMSGPPLNAVDTFIPRGPRPCIVPLRCKNSPEGMVGPGLSEPLGRPSNLGHSHGPMHTYKGVQPSIPQNESFVRPPLTGQQHSALDSYGATLGRDPLSQSDFVEQCPPSLEIEKNVSKRPGFFGGRVHDSHPHGATKRGPFGPADPGVPGAVKVGSPLVHAFMSAPAMQDERLSSVSQEQSKPSSGPIVNGPLGFGRDSGLETDSGFCDDNAKKDISGNHPDFPEPPGYNPKYLRFEKSFGGENPGNSVTGEPGIRSIAATEHFSRDGKELFDNERKSKPGSFLRHSQSREHQRKAMDMASSGKEQNNKKHRASASVEEGKDGANPKTSCFKG